MQEVGHLFWALTYVLRKYTWSRMCQTGGIFLERHCQTHWFPMNPKNSYKLLIVTDCLRCSKQNLNDLKYHLSQFFWTFFFQESKCLSTLKSQTTKPLIKAVCLKKYNQVLDPFVGVVFYLLLWLHTLEAFPFQKLERPYIVAQPAQVFASIWDVAWNFECLQVWSGGEEVELLLCWRNHCRGLIW